MFPGYCFPLYACGMIMGNYLGSATVGMSVMAAERPTVGIAHFTVVPENFRPAEPAPTSDGERTDRDD